MTHLWRISRHADLDGLGGEKADARWHTAAKDKRIVYLSEHPAVALLEVLANLKGNPKLFPNKYLLLKIAVEDSVFTAAQPPKNLPANWRADIDSTQHAGDSWLATTRSALLAIPSVPSPESLNYLLNPRHPHAKRLTIAWSKWIDYDQRLFHLHEDAIE